VMAEICWDAQIEDCKLTRMLTFITDRQLNLLNNNLGEKLIR